MCSAERKSSSTEFSGSAGDRARIKATIAGRYVIEWEVPAEYLRRAGAEGEPAERGDEGFEISLERLVVGSRREGDVSVVLDEASVDERHGEFALDEKGELIYRDLGSRYGSILYALSAGGGLPEPACPPAGGLAGQECAYGSQGEQRELAHLTREGCSEFTFDESLAGQALFGRQLYLQVGQVETFLRVFRM
jgi:hypothetical protein